MAPNPASPFHSSPPKTAGAEGKKKTAGEPEIEVVSSEGTPPASNVEHVFRKTGVDTIVDTVDVLGNLIHPRGGGVDKGAKRQSPPFDVHSPPWSILQGDEIMNDPSVCREALRGFGIPEENERIRAFGHQNLQYHLASLLVGVSLVANAILEDWASLARREEETIWLRGEANTLMKTAQALEERLNKQKAEFDALKKTEEWAASSCLKQVRSLTNLLPEEHNLWKEACARENENLYHLRQELNNLKAANATQEAEARSTAVVKEAEARGAVVVKELADANAERSKLVKTEVCREVKTREAILGDLDRRVGEAGARARQAEEGRDVLATTNAQLVDDRDWMRHFVIVDAILEAPENMATVANVNERAREAGFKASYNQCLIDVNPFSSRKFTDEWCTFNGVDTEVAYSAVVDAYNSLTIPALDRIKACLDGDDYVDRLRRLFEQRNEGEGTSGGNVE
ncbi:hypothetical protein Hanom_Chr03g00218281 [Helianthus anomalus]